MSRVLLVANADSPLLVERVHMSLTGKDEVFWYSESHTRPEASCPVYHYKKLACLGPLNKLLSTIYFFYIYNRVKPDVLHVHWALFLPLMFRRHWKNLIVSVMGSDVNLPGRFGSRRFFARIAFNRATAITSKSSGMDSAINRLGDYSTKLHRFTWGVSDTFFGAKQRRFDVLESYGIPDDALVIFSPRAMQPLYRIPAIVQAFEAFAVGNKKVYLLMAGMNASDSVNVEVDALLTKEEASGRVVRLGRLDKEGMINCYAAADIVFSYAKHDGMPQSLYEAMAAGCFPIFTDLPCYYEILTHQRNALLCDTDDAASLLRMLEYYQARYQGDITESIALKNQLYIRQFASKSSEQKRLLSMYGELSKASLTSSESNR